MELPETLSMHAVKVIHQLAHDVMPACTCARATMGGTQWTIKHIIPTALKQCYKASSAMTYRTYLCKYLCDKTFAWLSAPAAGELHQLQPGLSYWLRVWPSRAWITANRQPACCTAHRAENICLALSALLLAVATLLSPLLHWRW